jgi:hypothetical protein
VVNADVGENGRSYGEFTIVEELLPVFGGNSVIRVRHHRLRRITVNVKDFFLFVLSVKVVLN